LLIIHEIFEGEVKREPLLDQDIAGLECEAIVFATGQCPSALKQRVYFPTRIPERAFITPKTCRSHKITTITTTAFKIDLMEPAMGLNRLMSQRITPTTIRTTMT